MMKEICRWTLFFGMGVEDLMAGFLGLRVLVLWLCPIFHHFDPPFCVFLGGFVFFFFCVLLFCYVGGWVLMLGCVKGVVNFLKRPLCMYVSRNGLLYLYHTCLQFQFE